MCSIFNNWTLRSDWSHCTSQYTCVYFGITYLWIRHLFIQKENFDWDWFCICTWLYCMSSSLPLSGTVLFKILITTALQTVLSYYPMFISIVICSYHTFQTPPHPFTVFINHTCAKSHIRVWLCSYTVRDTDIIKANIFWWSNYKQHWSFTQ